MSKGTFIKDRVNKQRPKVMAIVDGKTGYVDLLDYELSEGVTFGSLIDMFLNMKIANGTGEFIAVEEYPDGSVKNAIPIHKIIEIQDIPSNLSEGFQKIDQNNKFAFDKEKFANERRR